MLKQPRTRRQALGQFAAAAAAVAAGPSIVRSQAPTKNFAWAICMS